MKRLYELHGAGMSIRRITRKLGVSRNTVRRYLRAPEVPRASSAKDARAQGETEQRLYALDAWREMPFFTDRERTAFARTEAVTLVH